MGERCKDKGGRGGGEGVKWSEGRGREGGDEVTMRGKVCVRMRNGEGKREKRKARERERERERGGGGAGGVGGRGCTVKM